jgi:transposase
MDLMQLSTEAVSDEQWTLVESILQGDTARTTQRRVSNPRRILDAILWVESNHESWKHLPATYPPSQTCYKKYLEWRTSGKLTRALEVLATAPGQGADGLSDDDLRVCRIVVPQHG